MSTVRDLREDLELDLEDLLSLSLDEEWREELLELDLCDEDLEDLDEDLEE